MPRTCNSRQFRRAYRECGALPLALGAPATFIGLTESLLHFPFVRTYAMQSRAFSVVGPLVRNGIPLALQSLPRVFSQKFLRQLKTPLFGRAGVGSTSE